MKSLILTLTTLWVCFAANAGIIEWTNRIHTPHGGTPVEIGEPEAVDSVRATIPSGTYLDAKVINRISLGIDLHYPKYFGSAMDVAVQVKVKRWDVALSPLSDTLIWLNVKYTPSDTLQMIALNKVEFMNAYKMVFSIEEVTVNGASETILPANLYVQGDIFIERYRELNPGVFASSFLKVDRDCNGTDDALEIAWAPVVGAEEYQLEWAYVNDYATTLPGSMPESALKYNFKFNSTRISTSATSHTISLVFDRGYIIYRVRAVGVLLADPSQYIYGPWNVAEKGTVDQVTTNKVHITGMEQHEGDVNWQYSATYAEQGKQKEVVSYFDGSLRNRQTVTRINSDNNIVVGETIYDHQGRAAITVLPVPVTDSVCAIDPNAGNSIHLYRDFNKVDGTNAYSAKDFDISDTNAICEVGAAPMNTVSGASNYYSTDNPNKVAEQGYVPDANGYPFTQVEFTPDNTGRIRRQGGVGQEFQIGSGHETRYLYGQPNQLELDRLFGSEMGDALHYEKNVVIDAHEQASISYLDQQDRVIATALAGDAPDNLEGIESESLDAVELEVNAFGANGNQLGMDNRSLVFATELLVAYQSEHTFSYNFEILPVDMECLEDVCVDCVYDLTIELVDECGINLAPSSLQNRMVGKFSGNAVDGYTFHAACANPLSGSMDTTFSAILAPGAYSLTKKLTVNQAALDSMVALYLKSDCAMTLEDFQDIALSNVDTSGCEITCDNCFEQLGSLEDFIADGFGNSNDYYLRVQQCEQLCKGDATYCEIMATLLSMDVSPGGQYGEYLNPETGAYAYDMHLVSVYNPSNLLPNGAASWRNPVLHTPQGQQNVYLDENGQRSRIYLSENPLNPGVLLPAQFNAALIEYDAETGAPYIYPENLATTADFINEFQQSWGRSLMVYHPEYCYYETCLTFEEEVVSGDAFTSSDFDMLMQRTNTIDQAIANGLVTFDGTSYTLTNWFAPQGGDNTEDVTAWDPFIYYSSDFNTTWCIGNYGAALQDKFTNYQYFDGAWRSMPEIASFLTRCGTTYATSYPTSCYQFGQSVLGVMDMEVINQEWTMLRSIYLSEKQKIQRELYNCKAVRECDSYNGCIGNEDFNPYTMMHPFTWLGTTYFPFMDIFQPCGLARFGLYPYKIRRFTDETALPAQNTNAVAYEIYLQTGQCPVEFTFQNLLANLAQEGDLTAPDYALNSNPHFSAVAQAMNNFNIPGTLPAIQHQGSVSGNTLTVDWVILPATVYTTITMNLSGTAGWSQVNNIVNLDITGAYSFVAEAVIYDPIGDSTYTEHISGAITMELPSTCDFAPECSSNELAKKLTLLLNTLHLDNQVASTSPIDITPFISGTYGTFSGLTDIYIENAAGVGPNLSYVFDGVNTGKIYDPSGVASDGLYVQFNGTFTPAALATISHFGNITSIGNNSFQAEAFLNVGGSATVYGALFREINGERIGIKVGDCDLPTPAACQTQAHDNFADLQDLLHDVLIVQGYDGTGQIDLYSSVEITPAIISGLPFGVTETTSDLSPSGDTLTISAGTCDIVLSAANPNSFANIVGIKDFVVVGQPNNYQNTYDFECTGLFIAGGDTLEATINGTSCLPIKDCNPCTTPQDFNTGEQGPAAFNTPFGEANGEQDLAQYDENLEEITEYNAIREYLYDTYLQRAPSNYCEDQYENYAICLSFYNDSVTAMGPGSGLFLIPDSIPYDVFAANGLCADRCVDELCVRLNAILAGTTTLPNQNALVQYINFNNYCGVTPVEPTEPCEESYEQYLDCISYYNANKDSTLPGISNVMTLEVFAASKLCLCVDEYCSRLNDLLTGVHTFGPFATRRDFDRYLTITSCTSPPPCAPYAAPGAPAIMPEVEISNNCVEMLINQAYFEAQIQYQNYVDSLSNALIQQYIDHCLGVQETFKYTYDDKLYHYTLYYYDQAGNLVKTIPPAGVERLDLTSSYSALSQQIEADRINRTKTVFTNHRLATRNEYNSLNQLVYQSTPDTDPMEIFELTLPNGLHKDLITHKIQMVNENVGYLGGEVDGYGVMYQTNDGGITWVRVFDLIGADLKKVIQFSGTNMIAIGEKGTILNSTDGGTTWHLSPEVWQLPGTGFIHDLNDIALRNVGGVLTFIIVGENKTVIKVTINGGSTTMDVWNAGITEPATASVTSVISDGTNFYITVNDNAANTATIYRMPTAGTSWVAENSFTTGPLKDVDMYSATGAYAVGEDGRMYQKVNADSGTERWKHVKSDLKNTIHTVRFFTELSGVALVEVQPGLKSLMRTFNGGQTWQQVSVEPFNHLAISANRSHVIAVGNNGKIEVVLPGNILESVPVASGTTEHLTAGWLDNQPDVNGVSKPHILVTTASGKIRYTVNGFAVYPSWTTNDQAALIGSDNIVDIRAQRGWASNQTIYGAAITQAGVLYRLDKQAGSLMVDLFNIAGSGHKGLATLSGKIYTVNSTGNQLASVSISASLVDYASLGTVASNISSITALANTIIGVGSAGTIANITLNGTHTAVLWYVDEAMKTNPNRLSRITQMAGLYCMGDDGVLYKRSTSPSVHWQRFNTGINERINDLALYYSTVCAIGSDGLMTTGSFSGNTYSWQPATTVNGTPISTLLDGAELYKQSSDFGVFYAVGQNGKVVYNPAMNTQTYNVYTTASQKTLYDVIPSGSSVIIAGADSYMEKRAGINSIRVKELLPPPIIDLHFRNTTTGTYLSTDFVVRRTTAGSEGWQLVYPNSAQAPTNTYRKVWTKSATESYIFGDNSQYSVNASNVASPITISGTPVNNVKALAQGSNPDILHLINGSNVIKLNLSTLTAATPVAIGSSLANAIHVFRNGSYLVVGEGGLYNHFSAVDASMDSNPIELAGYDFNAIAFTDNITGTLVGDNGAYFTTTNPDIDPQGYLTAVDWNLKTVTGSIDPLGATGMNIYTIAFATPTSGIFGGTYIAGGPFSHAYVRKVFDANSRYSSRFFYDRLGRMVVSQNARQYNASARKFSYTLYDQLGRVIEVGEKTENDGVSPRFATVFGTTVSNYFNPSVIDDAQLQAWIQAPGERREVTSRYYDYNHISGLPTEFDTDYSAQNKRIVHVTYEELYDANVQTYDHASHYQYDIHGNVKTLVHDNKKMSESFPSIASQRFKRVDYAFDLVSGNLNRMSVQNGEVDQWHHTYHYDADNRLTKVYTNTVTPLIPLNGFAKDLQNEVEHNSDWQNDATYFYYDHGALARLEIGQNNLQGIDYYYTLQGTLKGMNSSILDLAMDPGKDGNQTGTNSTFAKDVFGLGLLYYSDDYNAINGSGSMAHAGVNAASHAAANSKDLYNGNIRYMQTAITDPLTRVAMPMLNSYKFDQLNRIIESRSYEAGLSSNVWNPIGYGNEYYNAFTYNADGNILTQKRHKRDGTKIEDLTYQYNRNLDGNLIQNRLYHVNDLVGSNIDDSDIDDMGQFEDNNLLINTENNYSFDEEGRLIRDRSEDVDSIAWRGDGKIKSIHRPNSSSKKNLIFDYDAMGNRIAKHVINPQTDMLEKSTYYILDAHGQQLSKYDHFVDSASVKFNLQERTIFGSGRLGIISDTINMYNSEVIPSYGVLGNRTYELTTHLGSVIGVISDHLIALDNDQNEEVDGFQVSLISVSDYSPFGVQLDGRTIEREYYRYGYQGSERDDEFAGNGNSYTTLFRQLDPRLGRWLSVDPKEMELPWQSPYCSMDNNPILHNDVLGDKIKYGDAKGSQRRELRRMIREARKQDDGFNQWYLNRRSEAKMNTLRLTASNDGNNPVQFTSPKYIDGTTGSRGVFVSIDNVTGTETGGNAGQGPGGNYYFNRLQVMNTRISRRGRSSDYHTPGAPNFAPGFHFDRETQTYKTSINLKEKGSFSMSGYVNITGPGLNTATFTISNEKGTVISQFEVNHARASESIADGTVYGPILAVSDTRKINIEIAVASSTNRANWSVRTAQMRWKTKEKWKFNPVRIFKRERLTNL